MCAHIRNKNKCCAGAPCRQLWATAGALSCKRRGAFSDFPISPSRVRCAASTSRPTAIRGDDTRAPCSTPAIIPSGPRRPQIHLTSNKVSTEAQRESRRGVFAHFATASLHHRELRRSVSQARLVNIVWRRRRMRPVFRPDYLPTGNVKPRRHSGGSVQPARRQRKDGIFLLRLGWKCVLRREP